MNVRFKTQRPNSWELKRAVIERDGLERGCYWCGLPFFDMSEVTLEHIVPLADGGAHEMDNCALAHPWCNQANVPKTIQEQKRVYRQKVLENIANNGGNKHGICPPEIFAKFPALYRVREGKSLDHAAASCALKSIHKKLCLPAPSPAQKKAFRSHFNRWANENPFMQTYPEGFPVDWALQIKAN